MPDFLEKFLDGLSGAHAKELWVWLDENPDAVEEMIERIVDEHKALRKDVYSE